MSPIYCNFVKTLILAGGRGTRLKPLTDIIPKPLVPVKDNPIIVWQINFLKKFGLKDFTICTGYKTEQIEHYLQSKNNLGVNIEYSIEKKPLGTGGAIKKGARKIKDKSFLVINGDVMTDLNLKKLFQEENSIAAIELRTKFGILQTNPKDEKKIVNFLEKRDLENIWMNAGIYHLNKEILKDLPTKGNIENTTFPKYAKKGKLKMIRFRNVNWFSIDSFRDLSDCSEAIKTKKMFS